MASVPIADLHCDLLLFLQEDRTRTPYDARVRCSIPQLREGIVRLQTLPIFSPTGLDSAAKGMKQAKIFQDLPKKYPELTFIENPSSLFHPTYGDKIGILLAIENASAFCSEEEPLKEGLKRLSAIIAIGRPLYISLTWNAENRFGGGALTAVGLKDDGKRLLEHLHQKKIAVDLSHASDHLAHDIFNEIDKKNFEIPIMASHSNFRAVTDVPRNLPNEIALEIWRRGGIVGLNFIRLFVGLESPEYFAKHLEHGLKLGGLQHLCFGADFFFENDDIPGLAKHAQEMFFPSFGNASTYQKMITLCQKFLKLPPDAIDQLAYRNFLRFWDLFLVS